MKREDLSTWNRVQGTVREAWISPKGEVVLVGDPTDDEQHNCDQMGCGQDHVLFRGRLR